MARKSSDPALRTASMQKKVLEFLMESGNISYSCKRAGISRETYYQWRQNPAFAHSANIAIEYGKGYVNDLAHTYLIQNIQKGDMQAVRFQLASCHPDYQPKRPRLPDESIPVPITTIKIDRAAPKTEEVQGS